MHQIAVTLDRRSSPPVGFRHAGFARSMSGFGKPVELPRAGGWAISRAIPRGDRLDAMGVYPFTVLRDWDALAEDLEGLGDLVSLTIVSDPFAPDPPVPRDAGFEVVRPFKPHYVVDLETGSELELDRHHRRQVKRSLDALEFEVVPGPTSHGAEWWTLYQHTIERHGLTGIQAFSRESLEGQLQVPGAVMVRALLGGRLVAANLWFQDGDAAYGHLVGISPDGYRFAASYGLIWAAAEWFSGRCRWLDLGGTPGAGHDETSSLASFKAGWATGTVGTYLCGAILDADAYRGLSQGAPPAGGYFPAYRAGEMV